MIITIDGPAASGKSTISKKLAQKLSYFYLNTGFLYRAFAYALLSTNKKILESKLRRLNKTELLNIVSKLKYIENKNTQKKSSPHILFENKDITSKLKDPEIEALSSMIASKKTIRSVISEMQKNLAKNRNVVAEGRDCGTTVFPNAEYKFFLTASENTRALRWQKQERKFGLNFSFEESLKAVHERDKRDVTRKIAPLKPAKDAIIIDNSKLNIEQTLELILNYLKLK